MKKSPFFNTFLLRFKRSVSRFATPLFILAIFFSSGAKSQTANSLVEMPLKDRYALFAWRLESQNLLNYAAVDHPDFRNFSIMLLRDVFPEERSSLSELLKANNNEFGKKMFTDSIVKYVQLLKPYPLGRHYIFYGKGDLSEYDFNNQRFSVNAQIKSHFDDLSPDFFTESTGMVTARYKRPEEIAIPVLFSMPAYQNDDTLSLYRKGWNLISLPPDKAQKLIEKIVSQNVESGKREVYIKLTYSPTVFHNHIVANIIDVSYSTDSLFSDIICSYPAPKPGSSKPMQTSGSSTKTASFAEIAFIRNLTPPHEKFRYVIYKGLLKSDNSILNGKEFYFSAIYENFSERGDGKFLQLMANSLREFSDDPYFPKYWCQAGSKDNTLWIEGFRGLSTIETGKKGIKTGIGSIRVIEAHEILKDTEFTISNANNDFYSIEKQFILYDKKGREIANCVLNPYSGEITEESIHEKLLFIK